MTFNPNAVIFHGYMMALALVFAAVFGTAAAFIPLGIGVLLLIVTIALVD